jgi:hypothetical protein
MAKILSWTFRALLPNRLLAAAEWATPGRRPERVSHRSKAGVDFTCSVGHPASHEHAIYLPGSIRFQPLVDPT